MNPIDVKQIKIDGALAAAKGITFSISTKDGKAKPWIEVQSGLIDLPMAIADAGRIQCFEVAIFAVLRKSGGFFYWSSRHPNLFGSDVIAKI